MTGSRRFWKKESRKFFIRTKNYWNQKKNIPKLDVRVFVKNLLNSFFLRKRTTFKILIQGPDYMFMMKTQSRHIKSITETITYLSENNILGRPN